MLLPRILVLALAVAHPTSVEGQQDTAGTLQQPMVLQWWHSAAFLGGLSVLMLLDRPAQQYVQDHRSGSADELSGTLRHVGQMEIYGTVTVALVAAGLVSDDTRLTRLGGRLATTFALAGATSSLSKVALGRPRPDESLDADGYLPLSGQDAMPSGHTTMAFALATTLADEIDRTWVSVGLYTLAAGVGWSRINDNRHWLTDIAGGAAVGITSSKLVSGRWRIFGVRPPQVLLGSRPALAWQFAF